MATTTQIRTSTKLRQRAFSLAKLLDWAAILVLAGWVWLGWHFFVRTSR